MDEMELTAEEINVHIDKFKSVKDNPIPDNTNVTIWCEGEDESGFLIDTTTNKAGIMLFIAKSWIEHNELLKLLNK